MEVVSRQIFPDDPSNIVSFFAVEANHAPQSVCAKADARSNMPCMVVTLDTSHSDRSLLKDVAKENIKPMSVTLDTSHFDRSALKADAK